MTFKELAETIGENVENAGGSVIQLGGEQIAVEQTAFNPPKRSEFCR
jgi:hypothetical protein